MSQGAQTFFEYFGRIQVGFWENSSWHLGEFKLAFRRIQNDFWENYLRRITTKFFQLG